ncbi:MAG: AlpA family transcriptional regulator [Proteus vulgaris]|nr:MULTISPECIES: AlpA family transcriptional regulator [Proteus]MCH4253832.1 AlpA family transcriptional regulator [Proteus vulgaris]WCG92327.1 AlpA family transcriptional regulator [Proteus terrae]
MNKLGISSRQTLWDYERRRKFPRPIRLRPKAYLRTDVYKWIKNGGASQITP